MKLRIRRVQFLRALNNHCYTAENQHPHVHFDHLLERIFAKVDELHSERLGFRRRTRAPSPPQFHQAPPTPSPRVRRAQSNTPPPRTPVWGGGGLQRSISDQGSTPPTPRREQSNTPPPYRTPNWGGGLSVQGIPAPTSARPSVLPSSRYRTLTPLRRNSTGVDVSPGGESPGSQGSPQSEATPPAQMHHLRGEGRGGGAGGF